MTSFIISTSGFILPKTDYFKEFEVDKNNIADEFLNKSIKSSINSNITEFYKNKKVHISPSVTSKFIEYLNNPTFYNYITLVDISIDILKDISPKSFFLMQASNKYISPISFKFCLDVISNEFLNNYKDYSILPSSVRFTLDNGLNESDIKKNIYMVEKSVSSAVTWSSIIMKMYKDKMCFSTFFKYIFVDQY